MGGLKNIGIITHVKLCYVNKKIRKVVYIKLENSDDKNNYYFKEKNENNAIFELMPLNIPIFCSFNIKSNTKYEFFIDNKSNENNDKDENCKKCNNEDLKKFVCYNDANCTKKINKEIKAIIETYDGNY